MGDSSEAVGQLRRLARYLEWWLGARDTGSKEGGGGRWTGFSAFHVTLRASGLARTR